MDISNTNNINKLLPKGWRIVRNNQLTILINRREVTGLLLHNGYTGNYLLFVPGGSIDIPAAIAVNYADFGSRIKYLRIRAGLSQQEAARLLYVSLSTLEAWEKGRRAPRAAMLPAIAPVLNTRVEWLAEGLSLRSMLNNEV